MKEQYLHPEVDIVHLSLEQHILDGSGETPNPVEGGNDFWD